MLERAPEYEMMMICMPASVFNESQNHFQSSGSVQASEGCLREKFSVLLLPRQSGSSKNCFIVVVVTITASRIVDLIFSLCEVSGLLLRRREARARWTRRKNELGTSLWNVWCGVERRKRRKLPDECLSCRLKVIKVFHLSFTHSVIWISV